MTGENLNTYLHRSPAARAALSIYRQLRHTNCGGMTFPAVCWLLSKRFPESTVAHALTQLHRFGCLRKTGGKVWTKKHGSAWVWKAA